jgi:oxygen-independent coproporphyrinogen-3 oxidase
MVRSIADELVERKNELGSQINTIYFGGGTPSLLNKKELSTILERVFTHYSVSDTVELTLEANPENTSYENAVDWKELGINRVSVGLQSFKKEDLVWMNRGHTKEESLSCVESLKKAGIINISVDLMYGLPGLSANEWLFFLKKVTEMNVPHISAYCLTVEDKTKLKHDLAKGKMKALPEQQQVEQFDLLVSFLKDHGYEHYEVSNFAKEKAFSNHNTSYWKRQPYIGVGPSAHSFNGTKRRWNISNNRVYLSRKTNQKNWYSEELLSDDAQWNELFLTGLRTKWGVSYIHLEKLGGFRSSERKELLSLQNKGLVLTSKQAVILSNKGMLFADGISESFFRVS